VILPDLVDWPRPPWHLLDMAPVSRRGFVRSLMFGGMAAAGGLAAPALAFGRGRAGVPAPNRESSWEEIRAQFALGHHRVYLNNGTLGPSPRPVLERVIAGMNETERTAEHAEPIAARARLAAFVGAGSDEIAFTHNTTEGINIVAWGLPLRAGDEVIVTTHEHAGSALPWLNRARLEGIALRTFTPAATADETLARISALVGARTRVIAVPHVSCTTGQVFPVAEIAGLGRARGLFTFFDGAHGAGMLPLPLRALGCDFYASCGHKWLCGPKGTGFLYVRRERLDVLQARWIGAYCDTGWDLSVEPPVLKGLVPTAHRYDYGTQNSALFEGLAAAADFIEGIGAERVYARGRELASFLNEELRGRADRLSVLTPLEERSRAMITGFRFHGARRAEFGAFAASRGYRVRMVGEAGLDSVRISTHLYNDFSEVRGLLAIVDEFQS
jgi:selenocysteine lyase/cysteine desulfurase